MEEMEGGHPLLAWTFHWSAPPEDTEGLKDSETHFPDVAGHFLTSKLPDTQGYPCIANYLSLLDWVLA